MIRCTIEMIPLGSEKHKRVIGIIEIGNSGTGNEKIGNYRVILRKTPPWKGALVHQWKSALIGVDEKDKEIMSGKIEGFDRTNRGPYDLLFKALKACGLNRRNL